MSQISSLKFLLCGKMIESASGCAAVIWSRSSVTSLSQPFHYSGQPCMTSEAGVTVLSDHKIGLKIGGDMNEKAMPDKIFSFSLYSLWHASGALSRRLVDLATLDDNYINGAFFCLHYELMSRITN